MNILLIGGPDNPEASFLGGFGKKLEAAGLRILDWWPASPGGRDALPAGCEGVVVIKTYVSHTQREAAGVLANEAKVPWACVPHQWAQALPLLERNGFLNHDALQEMAAADPAQLADPDSPPPGPGWISSADAAAILGVDRGYLAYLSKQSKLPEPTTSSAAQRGGRPANYWPETAIEALLAERLAKAKPEHQVPRDAEDDNVAHALAPEPEAELTPVQDKPQTKLAWAELVFNTALEVMVNEAIDEATADLQAELAETRGQLKEMPRLLREVERATKALDESKVKLGELVAMVEMMKAAGDELTKQRDRAERKLERLQKTLKDALGAP